MSGRTPVAAAWVFPAILFLAGCAVGPRSRMSLYDQGLSLERRGKLDGALADLRGAVNLEPSNPVPREALARVFYERGWLSSATQAWEKVLAEAPPAGQPVAAARRRATAALLKIYLDRGAEASQGALWREASADYKRATELDLDSVVAWPGLAGAADRLGDTATAYLAYQRCFGLLPKAAALARSYAYAAYNLGHLDEALDAYRRYAALAPQDARGWNNEGTVLVKMGRFGESQACFDKALALQPGMIQALNGKGSACYYQGRYEEARGLWARVLDLAPDDPTATRNMRTLVKMGF